MLWIDNFFSSPELASKLKIKHSTDCVGTLKLNRKNVPKEVKDKKLEKGEITARHSQRRGVYRGDRHLTTQFHG